MDIMYGQRTTHTKTPQGSGKWVVIDATEKVLGRLSSRVAFVLMGKNKAKYQPGVLAGDKVIIINAANIKVSGDKMNQKLYHWHSGYFGGLKTRTMKKQMDAAPDKILYEAIKGMLPKNKYGRKLLTRVRIFQGSDHGMDSQKPEIISI